MQLHDEAASDDGETRILMGRRHHREEIARASSKYLLFQDHHDKNSIDVFVSVK